MNNSGPLETFVPLVFKRRGIRRLADTGAAAHDPTLIEAVARASLRAVRPLRGPRVCTTAPSMNCCA